MDDAVNNSSGTSISHALRSFDDLELADKHRQHRRFTCHHHLLGAGSSHAGNAAAFETSGVAGGVPTSSTSSIDMDLINRLALDSEIHNLMQRSPFAPNQLLYRQNRTSSIYTDSSDDISSLAGSDSLLWDDRSFTAIPNTRSAQIAKIVEYFERKRQAAESHSPHFYRGSSTGTASSSGIHSSASAGSASSSSSMAAAVAASALGSNYLSYETRRYSRHTALNSDYEAFCFELDKKPTQQRLMVCEGAVKSKLQIFDKLKQQQQHLQQQMQQTAAANNGSNGNSSTHGSNNNGSSNA